MRYLQTSEVGATLGEIASCEGKAILWRRKNGLKITFEWNIVLEFFAYCRTSKDQLFKGTLSIVDYNEDEEFQVTVAMDSDGGVEKKIVQMMRELGSVKLAEQFKRYISEMKVEFASEAAPPPADPQIAEKTTTLTPECYAALLRTFQKLSNEEFILASCGAKRAAKIAGSIQMMYQKYIEEYPIDDRGEKKILNWLRSETSRLRGHLPAALPVVIDDGRHKKMVKDYKLLQTAVMTICQACRKIQKSKGKEECALYVKEALGEDELEEEEDVAPEETEPRTKGYGSIFDELLQLLTKKRLRKFHGQGHDEAIVDEDCAVGNKILVEDEKKKRELSSGADGSPMLPIPEPVPGEVRRKIDLNVNVTENMQQHRPTFVHGGQEGALKGAPEETKAREKTTKHVGEELTSIEVRHDLEKEKCRETTCFEKKECLGGRELLSGADGLPMLPIPEPVPGDFRRKIDSNVTFPSLSVKCAHEALYPPTADIIRQNEIDFGRHDEETMDSVEDVDEEPKRQPDVTNHPTETARRSVEKMGHEMLLGVKETKDLKKHTEHRVQMLFNSEKELPKCETETKETEKTCCECQAQMEKLSSEIRMMSQAFKKVWERVSELEKELAEIKCQKSFTKN